MLKSFRSPKFKRKKSLKISVKVDANIHEFSSPKTNFDFDFALNIHYCKDSDLRSGFAFKFTSPMVRIHFKYRL